MEGGSGGAEWSSRGLFRRQLSQALWYWLAPCQVEAALSRARRLPPPREHSRQLRTHASGLPPVCSGL